MTKIKMLSPKLKHHLVVGIAFISIFGCTKSNSESDTNSPSKPNIIIFYVDDLGYGDVGCYGANSVKTPNVDFLAKGGVRFTDAHCTAATCTPSRYSLLTGNYAFRNHAEILPGDAPLLIDTAQTTLPKTLQSVGYKTGVVGKWHLGLGYGKINWNKKITPGANEVGFDYSFLIPATGDRVPTVFVEDGKVVGLDPDDPIAVSYSERIDLSANGSEIREELKLKADDQHSQTVVNGVSRIGYMTGGEDARWKDEEFPNVLNRQAKKFIEESKNDPFFLYYSFHDIHVPRVPNEAFQGETNMGPRGDAIAQMDWAIGDILSSLKEYGVLENTLIIFTSDNGPVLDDGYMDQAEELIGDHDPAGGFRGGKYSAYEAGTRVPTIVYWKGKLLPSESDALVSQVDLTASIAALVDADLGLDVTDSQNQLKAWLGQDKVGRNHLIEESFTLSLRKGGWKYIHPFAGNTPGWLANKRIENGLSEEPQLYQLTNDKYEMHNLAIENPDQVQLLKNELLTIVNSALD